MSSDTSRLSATCVRNAGLSRTRVQSTTSHSETCSSLVSSNVRSLGPESAKPPVDRAMQLPKILPLPARIKAKSFVRYSLRV